ERNVADTFGAAGPDAVAGEQFLVLIDARGENIDEIFDALLPAPRVRQCKTADPDIAGHHPLAGEHFKDPQDLFALTDAVEEDAHGADVDGVSGQPDKMAVQAGEF